MMLASGLLVTGESRLAEPKPIARRLLVDRARPRRVRERFNGGDQPRVELGVYGLHARRSIDARPVSRSASSAAASSRVRSSFDGRSGSRGSSASKPAALNGTSFGRLRATQDSPGAQTSRATRDEGMGRWPPSR
uniref:hypothetical protein n=1 Tax=Burkholderia savannae TaxID=1637837 RepID=UPI003744A17A